MKKTVIYLASGRAKLNYPYVTYNDLFENSADLKCDMMSVDLKPYDILIASPPCNYYSRASTYKQKESSVYAQTTKHLLPDILDKFIKTGKPFIVENVRSFPLFNKARLFNKNCFVYFLGRHTYWTNIMFNIDGIKQVFDFTSKKRGGHCSRLKSYVQGGENVNKVFDFFIETVISNY